jgi:hypothetical protein
MVTPRRPRSIPPGPSGAPTTVAASPFKHGTLKDACYRILAVSGAGGAKVRAQFYRPGTYTALSMPSAWSLMPRCLQVQDMVKHIKAKKLAHLAGSTPANTICSALSSGANHVLHLCAKPGLGGKLPHHMVGAAGERVTPRSTLPCCERRHTNLIDPIGGAPCRHAARRANPHGFENRPGVRTTSTTGDWRRQ